MEKFVLLILSSSLYSIKANDCTANLPPCSDIHDIATIKCGTPAPGEDACTITCGAEDIDCPDIIAGLLGQDGNKIEHIDAGICKEKCREQSKLTGADPVCEFYRWEEEDEGKCILQTICGEPDIRCQSSDEPRCITGQLGCTEEGTPLCSLDSPVEYNPDNFHLICHGDSPPVDINVYSSDHIAEIPIGTVCFTMHKCDKWEEASEWDTYYRKLAVSCSAEGTWLKVVGTGNDGESEGMVDGNTLVEPTCRSECEDLVMIPENLEPDGTELICDTPLNGVNLVNGNSCMLFCYNHFAMSISCQFEHDGTKIWKDENWVEVTADNVKC